MLEEQYELVVGSLLVHAGVLNLVSEYLVVALTKKMRFEWVILGERQLASVEVFKSFF